MARPETTNHYTERVHRVMDHVRSHLDENLSLEQLARVAHFSPYHFHRVFQSIIGETVAEFTRRARTERAAYLMKASPWRQLGSIALDAGFQTQSDFTRAFKRQYGIAPSKWDRRSRLHDSSPPPAAADRPATNFEPRVIKYPACRLAYVRMRTYYVGPVLNEGYARLTSWLEERGVDWRNCALVGLSWDHYETTPLDQVRTDFGFVVPDTITPDEGIGVHDFGPITAVDVHCQGELSIVAEAWDYLYNEWFPQSGYEPDDMPAMMRLRRRPDQIGWDTHDLDCSIALRPLTP